MQNVIVSIIAPAFNGENCIKEFINSVIGQTLQQWELLIVDDGSTDNTVSIVEEYCKKDARIKLIQRVRMPKGSLTCRNIGLDECHGKYIIHFDSDDIVEPFALAQRVEFMEKNEDIDFATFRGESVYILDDGSIKRTGRMWGIKPDQDVVSAFLSVNYPFSVWNNIYRAKSFENYRWDERVKIYTDFSFIVPTLLDDYKHEFASMYPIDYLYRIGQKKAMTSNFIADDKFNSTKYLFEKTMGQIKTMPEAKEYKESFKHFFLIQYQRVITNGSNEQIKDFTSFLHKWYPNYAKIRITFLNHIALKKGNRGDSRKINLWYYLFFDGAYLFQWLKEHIVKG